MQRAEERSVTELIFEQRPEGETEGTLKIRVLQREQ